MNLMLNDYCNLKCKYCFAHLGNVKNNITDENMKIFIDFLKKSNYRNFRVLGGEPTLHPKFQEYVMNAINDPFFNEILIFTNGSTLNKNMIRNIASPKTGFLINLNSKSDIGELVYEKTIENIRTLVDFYKMNNFPPKITLGINIYDKDFEYKYIVDLTKELGLNIIRYSIVVPTETGKKISLEYYKQFIPNIMNFFKYCYENNIRTTIDCNPIPKCLFTKAQLMDLLMMEQNMALFNECCMPLDVRTNLDVTRCFPFYDDFKLNLKDYDDISKIIQYFAQNIDSQRYVLPTFEECEYCKFFIEKKCQGACMTYKFIKG